MAKPKQNPDDISRTAAGVYIVIAVIVSSLINIPPKPEDGVFLPVLLNVTLRLAASLMVIIGLDWLFDYMYPPTKAR